MTETAPQPTTEAAPTRRAGVAVRPRITRTRAGTTEPRPARRQWALAAIAVAFGLVMLTGAGLIVAASLIQEQPGWWRTVDPKDPMVRRMGSETFNRATTTLWQRRTMASAGESGDAAGVEVLLSEPWSFDVSVTEANAWLNADLPRWLENQTDEFVWPRQLALVQVDFSKDRIAVAAMLRQGEGHQVVSATVEPRLASDGAFWAPATWVHLGRLPVPASWVLGSSRPGNAPPSMIQDQVPATIRALPETQALFDALAGRHPVLQDPAIRLGDGRRVRLLSMTARDGRLIVTCQTELRRAPAHAAGDRESAAGPVKRAVATTP